MKNSKNKRAIILAIILLGLLLIAYKVIFMPGTSTDTVDAVAPTDVLSNNSSGDILNEIGSISFDMSMMKNQNFKSLKSIEVPLVSLPVGRSNPFSSISSGNSSSKSPVVNSSSISNPN